jgi:hypothetical protein
MAQSADSQLRAPEGDANARAKSRPNDHRFAGDVQFAGVQINLTRFAVQF